MISRSQMSRQLYQNGGIMGVARENYGFGSKFKKFVRNIIPNEVADIAVKAAPFVAPFRPEIAAAMRGIGRFDQRGSISDAVKQAGATYGFGKATGADGLNIPGKTSSFFGTKQVPGNEVDGLLSVDRSLGDVFGNIGDSISGGIESITDTISKFEVPELIKQTPEKLLQLAQTIAPEDSAGWEKLFKAATYLAGTTLSYLDQKRINKLREEIQAKFEAAQAGKRGQYNPGETTNAPRASFTAADVTRAPAMNGGRMGYAYGNSVQDGIMAAPQIAAQMGMPVGNPRQNQQGIAELDYREEGGFVPPIGIKEKEDDIPAMLSNNEFVFTADAVRNAGDGDVNEGARKMYTMMKQLENGGMV